jgi:hypothetical protein
VSEILRYTLFATFIGTLIATSMTSQTTYGQPFGNDCLDIRPIRLICPPPVQGDYKLPTGNWSLYVNGVYGILRISSVDNVGKVQGTIVAGDRTLCTRLEPCEINGSFNTTSGRISFLSHPTVPTFVAIFQNYTGYISQRVAFDVIDYTIAGIGRDVGPLPGYEFGWYATIRCLAAGPCLGVLR